MKRVNLKIRGRVQGVGYRMYAQEEAERLGLTGWIRNAYDGSVEAVAEGDKRSLEEFAKWCHQGPPTARVTGVETVYSEATDEFGGFSVSY